MAVDSMATVGAGDVWSIEAGASIAVVHGGVGEALSYVLEDLRLEGWNDFDVGIAVEAIDWSAVVCP